MTHKQTVHPINAILLYMEISDLMHTVELTTAVEIHYECIHGYNVRLVCVQSFKYYSLIP